MTHDNKPQLKAIGQTKHKTPRQRNQTPYRRLTQQDSAVYQQLTALAHMIVFTRSLPKHPRQLPTMNVMNERVLQAA